MLINKVKIMSKEYEAKAGIGFQIVSKDPEQDVGDFVQQASTAVSEDFFVFEVADMWAGSCDGVYLCAEDPFKYGNDLSDTEDELREEADLIGAKIVGDFGLHSGLYIY